MWGLCRKCKVYVENVGYEVIMGKYVVFVKKIFSWKNNVGCIKDVMFIQQDVGCKYNKSKENCFQ